MPDVPARQNQEKSPDLTKLKEKIDALQKRHGDLVQRKETFTSERELIMKYLFPARSIFDDNEGERVGERVGIEKFDDTGPRSLQVFADGISGYGMSQSMPWVRMGPDDQKLMKYARVRKFFQEMEEWCMWDLSVSNFYDQANNGVKDCGAVGDTAMIVRESNSMDRYHFETIHPKESFWDENSDGIVDVFHREYPESARNLLKIFGPSLDEKLRNRCTFKPYERYKVLMAIEPREVKDRKEIWSIDNSPYRVSYLLENQSDKNGIPFFIEDGSWYPPHVVWRWFTNTGESYGRGPGSDALVSIITLNRAFEDLLLLGDLTVNRPYMYPAEMENELDQLEPKGRLKYRDPKRLVQLLDVAGEYPIGKDVLDDMRESVREAFFVSFFLMWHQIAGQNRTATEVIEMTGEKSAIMGNRIGRMANEYLQQIFNRLLTLKRMRGELPPVPPELQDQGSRVVYTWIGPLFETQKKYHATRPIRETYQYARMFAEMDQSIVHRMNLHEALKQISLYNGDPQGVIRSDKEVNQIMQAVQRARMEAQQLQMLGQLAQNAKGLNEQPVAGTALDSLYRQISGQAANGEGFNVGGEAS